jgi:Leucine-rich repeat (LRR) protein
MRRSKPKLMGIVGAAGMGMTKLAKEFKENNKSRYSGSCLLSDVKESSPVSLLRKILEDLTQLNEQIDTVEQGIHKLKERISTCKASKYLIILDDVDDDAQMKALSPIWDVLSSNSFILVTSRYRDVLIGAGIKEASIYDLRSGSRTNLILAGDWLVELPPCLNQVKNLKELWLRDSPNLERLSTRFFQLQTRSSRSGSYPLLNRLTELTITDCGIIFLSQELKDMNNLKVLRVCNCPLGELSFTKEVKTISESDEKGVCPNLQHLWIYSCTDLVKVESMPKTLKTVDFSYCSALREIKGLPDLAGLEQLDISGCEEVEELPSLQTLKSLKSLKASKCYKLKSIKGLADLSRLQRLYVRDCHEIQELSGVEHCRSLNALDASKCYKLKSIKGLADLSRLQRLYVRDCHEIRELPCVENCRSLKALDARDCPKLQWADGVLDQLRQHLETCLVGYYDDGH